MRIRGAVGLERTVGAEDWAAVRRDSVVRADWIALGRQQIRCRGIGADLPFQPRRPPVNERPTTALMLALMLSSCQRLADICTRFHLTTSNLTEACFHLSARRQVPISQEVEVAPAIRQDRDADEKPLLMMFHRTLQDISRSPLLPAHAFAERCLG
eukprot:62401-Rhodomonas_salina.1